MNGINKKLDDCWKQIVKERAGNRCEYCGDTKMINAHHIVGRRNLSVRWLPDNGISLCPKHHVFSSEFSAHQTPTIFSDYLRQSRGDDFMDDLHNQANSLKKWTTAEKKEWLKQLKQCQQGQ